MEEINIILDFDGTIVEHRYPKIGKPVPHSLRVLDRLIAKGANIMLNTARCHENNDTLQDSIDYLKKNGVILKDCLNAKRHPIWELPFKNEIFIDDIADGIPLIIDSGGIDMVDWLSIEKLLEEHNII